MLTSIFFIGHCEVDRVLLIKTIQPLNQSKVKLVTVTIIHQF